MYHFWKLSCEFMTKYICDHYGPWLSYTSRHVTVIELSVTHRGPGGFQPVLSCDDRVPPGREDRRHVRNIVSCWWRGRGRPTPRWRHPPPTGSRWPLGWLAGAGRGRGDTQWHTDQTTQTDSLDTCAHVHTHTHTCTQQYAWYMWYTQTDRWNFSSWNIFSALLKSRVSVKTVSQFVSYA